MPEEQEGKPVTTAAYRYCPRGEMWMMAGLGEGWFDNNNDGQ
jgi:hypothetical protein